MHISCGLAHDLVPLLCQCRVLVVVLCASSCLARSDSAPSSTQGVMWQFDYDEGPGDWEGDDYATVGRDGRYHLDGITKCSDIVVYASEHSFDELAMELTLTAQRFLRDGVIGIRVRASADGYYEFQVRRGATMSSISAAIVKGGPECVELATAETNLTSMDFNHVQITAYGGIPKHTTHELLVTTVDDEFTGGMVGLHVNEKVLLMVDSIEVTPAVIDIEQADMHRLPGLLDGAGTTNLPEPSWNKLPEWRGFNLLFMLDHSDTYNSHFYPPLEEYAMISELGFFVRLPVDYRIWTRPDWSTSTEPSGWTSDHVCEYNIHVMLCSQGSGHSDGRPDLIRIQSPGSHHILARRYSIPSRS